MRMRQLYNKGNIFHLEITKKKQVQIQSLVLNSINLSMFFFFFGMIFKHYNKKFNGWA